MSIPLRALNDKRRNEVALTAERRRRARRRQARQDVRRRALIPKFAMRGVRRYAAA